HGHMWFSPIIPRNAESIFEANRVFAAAAREFSLPLLRFSLPATYWERSFIFIFGFPVTTDVATNRRNRDAFYKLIDIGAQHGWGEYRTAPAYQDACMSKYSLAITRCDAFTRRSRMPSIPTAFSRPGATESGRS